MLALSPSEPELHTVAKLLTEFVGTMFLGLTVSLTKDMVLAPLAIGFILMVLVYSGGHVSGGHYNPAVTLAVALSGRQTIDLQSVFMYIIVQIPGALCGALLAWVLKDNESTAYPAVAASTGYGAAFIGELLITMALCLVFLQTATSKAQANNSYYGLAIGCTVLSGAVTVGPFSGGAFNPAIGLMGVIQKDNPDREDIWVYFLAPIVGAILASGIFWVVAPEEYLDAHCDVCNKDWTVRAPTKMQYLAATCMMEFIGTLLLCFTVGVAAALNTFLVPLAIGSMLMVVIYAGGSVSGGHYNPAVTLGVYMRTLFGATHDMFGIQEAAMYWFFQYLGALAGTFCAWCLWETSEDVGYPTLPVGRRSWEGMLGEFIGTFLLVLTVLNVATVKQLVGNSFFGLAIGMSVTCMATAIGPVSGGAFNMAVALIGPFSGGANASLRDGEVWFYWIFCPLGAVAAAAFFRLMNYEEFHTDLSKAKFMAHVHEDAHGSRFQKHSSKAGNSKQVADAQAAKTGETI
jgi:aquaporin Z